MKKILSLLLVFTLMFTIVACGGNKTESTKEPEVAETDTPIENVEEVVIQNKLEEIKKSGKLVVGTSADYPPYEFHAMVDGKDTIVGFDIEFAKEIAKHLGVELELQDMEFSAVLTGVETGMIDLGVASIRNTPERDETMDFSKVYKKSGYTLLIRKEDEGKYDSIESLVGDMVGAQMGTIQEEFAKENYGENVVILPKITDLVLQLKSGMIDGVVVEIPVAKSYDKQNEDILSLDETVTYTIQDGENAGSVVVAKEGEKELLDEVNKVIDKLEAEDKFTDFFSEAIELQESSISD